MPAATLLIIDDEEGIRLSLRGILEDEGYIVVEAASAEQGLAEAETQRPDLIFLDIWLPGMDGLAALEQLKLLYPEVPVIMMSGHGTIETAVNALRLGAHDFVEKPLSLEKILVLTQHTLEMESLRRENKVLRAAMDTAEDEMVGQSPAMLELKEALARVAPTSAWVLITGENGTGKELAARAVHRGSKRAQAPLVAVNCAAIPEELIESELFGHEKGAFTGADSARIGKFELAHKGTLFLDEIGDMSLKTQAKILRILQEQSFERVGGNRSIHVDVRVIAATNKNLEQAIQRNEFRADLYYRLRVFPLHLPPLRERSGDIRLLVEALAQRMENQGVKVPLFTSEALEALEVWRWPGNVRELGHFIERMAILYPAGRVGLEQLPPEMRSACPASASAEKKSLAGQGQPCAPQANPCLPASAPGSPGATCSNIGDALHIFVQNNNFKSARAAFELYYLETKLVETGGNITKLAEMVGLERSYIHRKLKAGRAQEASE